MSKNTFRASSTQQGLTENMQILTGQKGDRLDRALTLREAAAIGMVNLRRNGTGLIIPELPPNQSGDPEWSGVQMPAVPTGVTADGAFHTITLTWDPPAYKGHSYTEVLRAEVDDPSSSVSIGTTLANVYSDSVGKGFNAYYWVRFINKNGQVGPLHSTAGLRGMTSPDVDEIIASATRFAIYNPAKPDQKEIVFGVTDDGKVAIREAVIKAATIQIIHSERITADYIKAGVSISAPSISGGSFDMGNAFMSGGSAGFGLGGPYSGWGKGWFTIIYSDGNIYTNRLRAEGGYIKNMTLGNCVIDDNCDIRGTLKAGKIIGVLSQTVYSNIGVATRNYIGGDDQQTLLTVNFDQADYEQIITMPVVPFGNITAAENGSDFNLYCQANTGQVTHLASAQSAAFQVMFRNFGNLQVIVPAGASSIRFYVIGNRKYNWARDDARVIINICINRSQIYLS
ncbi:hypothetical protein [Aeromonas sp. AE23HZ002T15]